MPNDLIHLLDVRSVECTDITSVSLGHCRCQKTANLSQPLIHIVLCLAVSVRGVI